MLNEDTVPNENGANEDIILENNVTDSWDNQENDIFNLLDSLITNEAKEIPTEPVFFQKEEEKKEEVAEEYIDEQLLEDLDNWFTELENELSELKENFTKKEAELLESSNIANAYATALDKLWDHPILWPLNAKILSWETLDIPEYLLNSLQEDIDALPKMEDIASEKTWLVTVETLQEKLAKKARNMY